MMTAYELAQRLYREEPQARTLEEDIRRHLVNPDGYVLKTPAVLAMGRPIPRNADPRDIINPLIWFPIEDCDCWHIYLVAGDIGLAWTFLPYPLPWLSLERSNRLRFYRSDRIKALSNPHSDHDLFTLRG